MVPIIGAAGAAATLSSNAQASGELRPKPVKTHLADFLTDAKPPQAKVEVVAPTPAPTVAPAAPAAPAPAAPAAVVPASGLIGSIGYANPYGNCVNEPGVNRQNGNPSSWTVTSRSPWIGATALFTYNHVGVVTGIWSNGDLEIRHQNYKGGQHRFPRSAFRGFR